MPHTSDIKRDSVQSPIHKTMARILYERVIAVIRTDRTDEALWGTEQLFKAGIRAFDVTFGVPGADEVIRRLRNEQPDAIVGAGTVLTIEEAERAVAAGATFLASPILDEAIIRYGQEHQVLVLPGVTTPTEMMTAIRAGASAIKFFPAEPIGGARYLNTVLAPLPHMKVVATGGIHENNFIGYLKAGAMAVGLGASLLEADAVAERNSRKVRHKVAVVMDRLNAFREGLA